MHHVLPDGLLKVQLALYASSHLIIHVLLKLNEINLFLFITIVLHYRFMLGIMLGFMLGYASNFYLI